MEAGKHEYKKKKRIKKTKKEKRKTKTGRKLSVAAFTKLPLFPNPSQYFLRTKDFFFFFLFLFFLLPFLLILLPAFYFMNILDIIYEYFVHILLTFYLC